MCGIYCVYKQSGSCQLPFCASPIFHFEIGPFTCYCMAGIIISISVVKLPFQNESGPVLLVP